MDGKAVLGSKQVTATLSSGTMKPTRAQATAVRQSSLEHVSEASAQPRLPFHSTAMSIWVGGRCYGCNHETRNVSVPSASCVIKNARGFAETGLEEEAQPVRTAFRTAFRELSKRGGDSGEFLDTRKDDRVECRAVAHYT